MKKILYLFAFTTAFVCDGASFTYVDTQTLGALPLVGLGVRMQKGMHAFDFSGNACPLNPPGSLTVFHFRSLYLVYPKQTGFYLGGGLGLLNEPETIQLSGSFESAVGYEWKNGIFIEGNGIVPFKQSEKLYPIWPGLTLGFGF